MTPVVSVVTATGTRRSVNMVNMVDMEEEYGERVDDVAVRLRDVFAPDGSLTAAVALAAEWFDAGWRDRDDLQCRRPNVDPAIWYGSLDSDWNVVHPHSDVVEARFRCRHCPARLECLVEELDQAEQSGMNRKWSYGVFGGLSAWEREKVINGGKLQPAVCSCSHVVDAGVRQPSPHHCPHKVDDRHIRLVYAE